ncbi:MAG: hypothetical protein ACFB02_16220 [Mastigocoleus sp.]
MKVWLACFLILFALAELFDWIQEFSFPLPIYILGGLFLAVASNYNELIGSYMSNYSDDPVVESSEPLQLNLATQTEHNIPTEIPQTLETPQENDFGA